MNGWFVVAVVVVPFVVIWIGTIVEVVRRRDLGVARTITWVIALVVLPVVAVALYVVVRVPPPRALPAPPAPERAERFVELAEARQRGALDDAAFASQAAALIESVAQHPR